MAAGAVVFVQLLGYWLAWLYSPIPDFIVVTSYERLAIQLAPMLLVLLAIGLRRYVGAGEALPRSTVRECHAAAGYEPQDFPLL